MRRGGAVDQSIILRVSSVIEHFHIVDSALSAWSESVCFF